MQIPIRVYEQISYDEYLDEQGPKALQASKNNFGDFILGATCYRIVGHSGCRHNWVNKELKGVTDVFVQGGFRKRFIKGAPGYQCTKCSRAKYS